jgi:hypothetical protein
MTTEAESTSVFSFSALIVVLLFAVGVLLLVYFTWYRPSQDTTSSTYIERDTTVTTPGDTNAPAEQPDSNTNINVAPSPAPDTAPAPEPGSAPNADTGQPAGEPAPAQ